VETLANTTVLSNFAAVHRLDLLRELVGHLYIPHEVYEEVLNGLEEGYEFYNAFEAEIYPLADAGWIEVISMDHEEVRIFHSLSRRLHHGEAACLAIAQRRHWAFLTDDRLARMTARSLDILVSGTLGVLVHGIKRGIVTVEEGDYLLRKMIDRGYRSPHSSLEPLLEST
jgi:predicted nucleic acid-binding protein